MLLLCRDECDMGSRLWLLRAPPMPWWEYSRPPALLLGMDTPMS